MALKPEHIARLRDKFWRLNNLYWITDKRGKPVRFRIDMRANVRCGQWMRGDDR